MTCVTLTFWLSFIMLLWDGTDRICSNSSTLLLYTTRNGIAGTNRNFTLSSLRDRRIIFCIILVPSQEYTAEPISPDLVVVDDLNGFKGAFCCYMNFCFLNVWPSSASFLVFISHLHLFFGKRFSKHLCTFFTCTGGFFAGVSGITSFEISMVVNAWKPALRKPR